MRQKELRIALICYGGISLAVYMHGVTREVWHLARASGEFHGNRGAAGGTLHGGVTAVYRAFLEEIAQDSGLRLRVMPDIVSGASAGGINAVFLAQALHSGQSLEPLTELWLHEADVENLIDPDARPSYRFSKLWFQPVADWLLERPGSGVAADVPGETRAEVRRKLSHFVRGRWFEPPFSGPGFSRLLEKAFAAMAAGPIGAPLLPPGHPLDLFVTATDYHGYVELLRLNSPPVVEDSEHRLPIGFRGQVPASAGLDFANPLELIFAARATASFPGAFPPLRIAEIDALAAETSRAWPGRDAFFERIMPVHAHRDELDTVSLLDGSVLVNKPFAGAIAALRGRPAQREVDRRFVYVDPRPDRFSDREHRRMQPIGFFGAIFGSLSTLPREQPIRDNLDQLQQQGRDAARRNRILAGLRPEVEQAVERLFGWTLFLDNPTPQRLRGWRQKAQHEAAVQAGYAFSAYAQAKFNGIVARLARLALDAAPELGLPDTAAIETVLFTELERRGLGDLVDAKGGATEAAIAFFREHDIGFRIRRLRLIARRLARDWEADPEILDADLEQAREKIFAILASYFERETMLAGGADFSAIADRVLGDPGAFLDYLDRRRLLPELDDASEIALAEAMAAMPRALRRRVLLTYLGFPFYDVATLPLLSDEGLGEFDAVKVDRISPEDARSIRKGGTAETLRGTEFYNFGAFFSRAYRENDYLWGRLHGAERLIDIVASTVDPPLAEARIAAAKHAAFVAILDEEEAAGRCETALIGALRRELKGI